MSIKHDEERLFSDWSKDRVGFVRDGVVSEEQYRASRIKLAFILKEVNDLGGGGWDLREFVREGGRPQTWNNIARWVNGILARPDVRDWAFYETVDEQFRIDNLGGICVVNLKKSPGTHTTDYNSLKAVAMEDANYIASQFALYDPDLTICGGTGGLFKDVVGHSGFDWHQTSRGIWWYQTERGAPVIAYAHPEARVQSSLLHYGLIDAVNEICS